MVPREAIDCKTHRMLKDRFRADLRVYQEAVAALGTTPDFAKAQELAEIARTAYEAARDRFNAHVSSHKCEACYIRLFLAGPYPQA
jgi:hypothetical protein